MGLADSILQATQAHNALAGRRYASENEQFKNDMLRYGADIQAAEAQNAPEFYQGRANAQSNQAGLLGLEMQYAPTKFALGNQLLQAQINSHNRANVGGYGGMSSPFGKLTSDYAEIVKRFGEDSPQAQRFAAYMQKQIEGKPGMTVYDPVTGNPLVSTGGGGNGGARGGGGTMVDSVTGDVISMPTNQSKSKDQRTIAGADNVKDYIHTVMNTLPQTMTASQEGKSKIQGLANYAFGTNYELPSIAAEGNAAITTAAEGFINTFGLNATNENVAKAEKIFKPSRGESPPNYIKRVDRQLNEMLRVQQRAQNRLARGNVVGKNQQALEAWAQQAIQQGADPAQVNARLKQMLGG